MSRHRYTELELITLLKDWELRNGEVPSQSQWDADVNTPSCAPVRSRFGSWSKGLIAAGLSPKKPEISEKCVAAKIASKVGSRSCNWKGGKILDKKTGYILIWSPEYGDNYKKRNKYVFEHRIVMSKIIGRALKKGENVHHKNGVRDDNRPENLELWVSTQPSGQRVSDLIDFAKNILKEYECLNQNPELLK